MADSDKDEDPWDMDVPSLGEPYPDSSNTGSDSRMTGLGEEPKQQGPHGPDEGSEDSHTDQGAPLIWEDEEEDQHQPESPSAHSQTEDTTLVQPPSPRASTSAMEPSGVEEPEPGLFPSLPLLSIKDEPMERYNATLQPQATASCIKEEQDQLERRLFPSLPLLSIKDEPIDEGYNAALQPQATANRIKEELDQLEDFDSTCSTEQLGISAVFSVSGSSDNSAAPVPLPQPSMLAPPRTAPAPAPPLTLGLAPPPIPPLQPTAPVIRCSGCSKVLQRGQTAFLRKGSNHLFCSTPCLTGTSFPPVAHPVAPPVGPPAPPPTISLPPVQCAMPSPPPQLSRKKFCCICHKEIVNLKDLIKAPIGHFMRDFCSQTCMESKELKVPLTPYRTVSKQGDDEITKCSICQRIAIVEHEVNHIGAMYKLCSDHCFSRFRVLNNVTVKGNASTQTDAMKLPSPPQRMLKNKALMCKPSIQEQGVQCMLEPPASDRHATAADLHATAAADLHTLLSRSHKAEDKEDEKEEKGEKVRLVPFPVPVMVPVFIPVPMHLYTQYTPVPMGIPIPVPVPFMVPSRPDGTGQETPEGWRTLSSPADEEEEEEDEDKEKDKPASMGDQGSTYSGDLESEAVSPPLSLEMESEGEPCEVSDGDDEREDEIELNLNLAPDSDSDSESESNFEIELGGSFQETARDGTVWVEQTAGSIRGRARECNIMRETPGPTDYAKDNVRSPLSSLLCLIDTEMWETIRIYTQAEADRNNADTFKVTADDLKAFVGLIYLRGITGGKSMNLDDYWSADLGNAMFKETMSRQKFRDIMRYLRFDDKNTRSVRLVADKFAMISEIFDKFVRNSIASYTPGENITVDEQLFPTKARCRFTQYMANKPDKFGIKFWVASDAETKYMLNAFPYLGKDESRPAGEQLSENVVMRLMEPFLGKGRNVTTDNFFTSLALAKNLLAHQTTIVGTMNKIRREMPPCTQAQSERYSTKVLRAGNATLTIYQRKPKKNVCILSTMHPTVSTDSGAKKLPNTIAHYNSTKVGVDVMDQMARLYSVKGRTRRWPVAVFYNLLDLAAINAHILYKQCMNISLSRRAFILELVKEMCANQKMAKAARAASRKRLLPETPSPPAKRRQCQIGRCWNKTFEFCQTCKRLVCGKCTKTAPRLCFEC